MHSDEEIIRLYKSSENEVYFEEIFKRYKQKIYNKIYCFFAPNSQSAEDVFQDVFVKVFLQLHTFSKDSKFSTWLYRVVHNTCIDEYRKRKIQFFPLDMDENEISCEKGTPDILFSQKCTQEEILDVLQILSGHEREILLLKYEDGLSLQEISDILDTSLSATKMRIKEQKNDLYYSMKKETFSLHFPIEKKPKRKYFLQFGF